MPGSPIGPTPSAKETVVLAAVRVPAALLISVTDDAVALRMRTAAEQFIAYGRCGPAGRPAASPSPTPEVSVSLTAPPAHTSGKKSRSVIAVADRSVTAMNIQSPVRSVGTHRYRTRSSPVLDSAHSGNCPNNARGRIGPVDTDSAEYPVVVGHDVAPGTDDHPFRAGPAAPGGRAWTLGARSVSRPREPLSETQPSRPAVR